MLQEKLNTLTDKREQKFLLLYCGLCHSLPPSFQEIQDIMNECDLSFLSCPRLLSILEIQELYRKAVGEVGIAPSDLYNMTPEEIEWAYEGYLRRKETEANLHRSFIKYKLRQNGEWFEPSSELLDYINTNNLIPNTFVEKNELWDNRVMAFSTT